MGRIRWARTLLGIAALGTAYPFLLEPNWLEVTTHSIALPITRPLRIAFISDLHTPGEDHLSARVAEAIAVAKVDVILVGGDLVHAKEDPSAVAAFLAALPATPLGIFAVPGNWEHWTIGKNVQRDLALGPGQWLVNDSVRLRPDLELVGLDDDLGGAPDVPRALASTSTAAVQIALMHSPSGIAAIDGKVALVLAGHTHGGQVRLPFLGALVLPPGADDYEMGWYRRGATPVFVTRGLGTSVLPVRFWCRPELAIIDLVPSA